MVYFDNFQHITLCQTYFLAQPNQMSHVFYTCVVPHYGNCEGWWSDPFHGSHLRVWLWVVCRHVFHKWAFRMSNMRGKDTLHSNGGCPRLDAVHAAAWRMDVVSIVNGNVCGRFRDVPARKVCFLQVPHIASLVAKRVPSSSRQDIIGRDE
jgi:hypothetical protein